MATLNKMVIEGLFMKVTYEHSADWRGARIRIYEGITF